MTLLDPQSRWKRIWDLLVGLAVVFSVVVAPLVLALDLSRNRFLLIADIVINVLFFADVVFNFHLPYWEHHVLVREPRKIRLHYLQTWFVPDLIAALPVFLIPGAGLLTINRIVRFFRLVRLLKIFALFRLVNHMRRIKVSSNVLRVVLMAFWLLLTAHIIACGFIIAGGVEAHLSPAMRYLQALYWTITTLATVGYGDIIPDRTNPGQLIFTICAQIAGVGMYGVVIGSISSIIYKMDLAKTLFMERLEKIYTFLQFRKIPPEIVREVDTYFDYLWESRRGYDEAQILAGLPHSIRLEIARHIHADIIAKVPLFKDANPSFMRDILLELEPMVFTPQDYIVHKGDLGAEMYFINRGSVDVISEDERTVYATLGEGAFFGEMALLFCAPRAATIKAREYCDLYALRKSSFDRILTRHPDFAHTVQVLAQKRKQELEPGGELGRY